ncbi:MAG: polysaccharide deacetylase family protein, partial [Bdellovibrionales bacterium]|nr:polysaccharide deacetylase family protein [Bdellovibrionales bacterium]
MLIRKAAAHGLTLSGAGALFERMHGQPWQILMYHRIIDPESVAHPLEPGMYVRPKTFQLHMEHLAKHYNVWPLDELAQAVGEGKAIPPRTVAITFDDGWRDNYENAFPVLVKHELPATVFLATAFVGGSRLFWTDRLARAMLLLWENGGDVLQLSQKLDPPEERPALVAAQEIAHAVHAPNRRELDRRIEDTIGKLKRTPPEERLTLVDSVVARAEHYLNTEPERAFITWDESREMARSSIRFGCHTVDH